MVNEYMTINVFGCVTLSAGLALYPEPRTD